MSNNLCHSVYVVSAFAGTWGENLGYYGFVGTRDVVHSRRQHKIMNKKYGFPSLIRNMRNLVFEFGFSEIYDSFITRPFFMYIFPVITGNFALGIIIGKLVADVAFYVPTIVAYELRKKHLTS